MVAFYMSRTSKIKEEIERRKENIEKNKKATPLGLILP